MERQLGTRYTVDTLRKITRRWPNREFVWLMGADNLAQFHLWKRWRDIARIMPIAVASRPGYDAAAKASPAMSWLGRFHKPVAKLLEPNGWNAPALVLLRLEPDRRSATAIRREDPDWACRFASRALRDGVTRRPIAMGAA
jgi:nicotinate-nucleotide adenylyltransferase